MPAVALVEHLGRLRGGDAEVDRLAARPGEPVEGAGRERDEVAARRLPAGVGAENGARREHAAGVAPDEPLPLERRDEARGGALRQATAIGELSHGRGLRGLDDVHEQLRRAVDRLGAGLGDAVIILTM